MKEVWVVMRPGGLVSQQFGGGFGWDMQQNPLIYAAGPAAGPLIDRQRHWFDDLTVTVEIYADGEGPARAATTIWWESRAFAGHRLLLTSEDDDRGDAGTRGAGKDSCERRAGKDDWHPPSRSRSRRRTAEPADQA